MAGSLDVLQRRYLGLEIIDGGVRLDPAPPSALGPVRLTLVIRGRRVVLAHHPGDRGRDDCQTAPGAGWHVSLGADASNAKALSVRVDARAYRLTPGMTLTLDAAGRVECHGRAHAAGA